MDNKPIDGHCAPYIIVVARKDLNKDHNNSRYRAMPIVKLNQHRIFESIITSIYAYKHFIYISNILTITAYLSIRLDIGGKEEKNAKGMPSLSFKLVSSIESDEYPSKSERERTHG